MPAHSQGDSPMNRQTAGTMGVCLLVAAVAVACGSGSVGSSVAHSSVAATPDAASASTSSVQTTAGDRGGRTPVPPPAAGESLRGEGVISRVLEGTACPALTFEIDGDTLKVSHDTRYGNGRCDDLQ